MDVATQVKEMGFGTLREFSALVKVSTQTLNNWNKNKPVLFNVVLLGAKQLKETAE